jgi:hypothetical protein
MAKKSKRRAWTAADVRTLKTAAKKENTGCKHCPNTETNRRGYAAKGL